MPRPEGGGGATGPLRGLGCLVTRPAHQAQGLCRCLQAAGARTYLLPALAIEDPEDLAAAARHVDRLADFDVVIFVSPNAAERGVGLMRSRGRRLGDHTLLAVGPGTTARLSALGIDAARHAEGAASSEGLLSLAPLQASRVRGKRILIFRGAGGRVLLGDTLQARGAEVRYAEVYRRALPAADPTPLIEPWDQGQIGVVITTSAEGLQNLLVIMGERRDLLLRTPMLVMSERMAAMVRALAGTCPPIVATEASDEGLVASLRAWYLAQRPGP